MRLISFAFAALLPFAALADSHGGHASHDDHHDHSEHVAEADGVTLLHGWARATHSSEGFAFVEIRNTGTQHLHLIGAESSIAAQALLVGHSLNGWIDVPEAEIAPGDQLDMAPDGLAIRLTGLTEELHENDVFQIHLLFEGGELEFDVLVEPANAAQHRHAGHQH